MSSNCLTVDTLRFDRFINISYSRALNRRDSLLINSSIFRHPSQPYSALPVYQFWGILPVFYFIPESPFINSCAQLTAVV